MRRIACHSKSPLPPSTVCLDDSAQETVDSSLEEQVGGGRRPPSPPPLETPTRLRTHVKASEKARGNIVVQQAELRRARMREGTEQDSLQPLAPCPILDNANADGAGSLVTPPSAVFLGSQPKNNLPDPGGQSDASMLDGPSTDISLQTVPAMRVIPPTPIPGDNTFSTASSSGATNAGPSTPTSGRRTTVINALLTAGYDELEAVLTGLVEKTNLTTQQILDGWHKSRSHIVSGINHWNQYTKYAMRHEEQERQRLGLPPCGPLSPTIRRQLYAKFKEDNPDTWQEILEVHDMVDSVQCSPQTIAQRAQTFNKVKRRIISMLESDSAKHGFEAAIIMCGSVVNEDASLGFTHTMGGATTFFETRCRANPDTMIGHLKSHIYNHVSLETVNEAFGDDGNQSKNNRLPALDRVEELTNDAVMAQIKDSMMTLLQSAGGDVSKFKRSTFPWTTLLTFLTMQGLVMKGWPDGVLMPGQLRHAGTRTKGIADLSHAERRRLQQALLAGEISVARLCGRDERRSVSTFEAPVIIGAPPLFDSDNTKALQMYGNGTWDADGPERLPPTAAATRIKPKRVPKATTDDPIIISSSSDDGPRIIPTKKKVDTTVKGKKKVVVLGDSSDDEVSIADDTGLPVDSKENLEEDYHEVVKSCKRKAKNPPATSRVNKKPIRALDFVQSKKGKERERSAKGGKKANSARWVDISSSDSEASTKTVKAQPIVGSQVHPACRGENDVFDNGEPVPGTVPGNFMPSTPKAPENIERPVEPSSPSPKRCLSLMPLTKLGTSRKSPDRVTVGAATITPPLDEVQPNGIANLQPAVDPQRTSMPPTIIAQPPVPTMQAPTHMLTDAGAEATTTALPLANPTGFPQMVPTLLLAQNPARALRDEGLTYGGWTEHARQVGGGYPPHAFHAPAAAQQPPYFPYYGNEGGILSSQSGVMSMRRGMYLDPTGSGYHGDIYGGASRGDSRGDSCGPYGGFYPRTEGPATYADGRDHFSGPSGRHLSPHPHPGPSRQSSVALSDTQQVLASGVRPTHPIPFPSRHPSVNPDP